MSAACRKWWSVGWTAIWWNRAMCRPRRNMRSTYCRAATMAARWAYARALMRARNSAPTMSFPAMRIITSRCWNNAPCLRWSGRAKFDVPVLGFLLDVRQHAHVNAMDDVVGPVVPVLFGPHGIGVPGCAGEAGAASGKFGEQELALMGDEV